MPIPRPRHPNPSSLDVLARPFAQPAKARDPVTSAPPRRPAKWVGRGQRRIRFPRVIPQIGNPCLSRCGFGLFSSWMGEPLSQSKPRAGEDALFTHCVRHGNIWSARRQDSIQSSPTYGNARWAGGRPTKRQPNRRHRLAAEGWSPIPSKFCPHAPFGRSQDNAAEMEATARTFKRSQGS